jgi:hypothetical protein
MHTLPQTTELHSLGTDARYRHDGADDGHCFSAAATAQMERLVVDFGRMYRARNDALQEVARAHHDALMRLARAAEYRDDDTGVHILRIGELACALALRLGQPANWARMLREAAPMHDVGKIGMPDGVLKKPGAFTAYERRVMNHTRGSGPTSWVVPGYHCSNWQPRWRSPTTSAGTARAIPLAWPARRYPCRDGSWRWQTSSMR